MSFIFLRNRATGGAAFSPASLFASGEEGAWYEPSTTTCFTDTSGTTAAGVGDAVARINDLSGNGNHATQASSAARPLLQQTAGGLYYLAFDGADGMATASIDFTATDKMSVFAGVDTDATIFQYRFIAELSTSLNNNNGTFALVMPNGPITTAAFVSKGTSTADASATGLSLSSPVAATGLADISGDAASLRIDGTEVASVTTDQGTGNFGDYPLYIGARSGSSFFFQGKIFSLIVRGAASTAQEISDTESYVANLSGVSI